MANRAEEEKAREVQPASVQALGGELERKELTEWNDYERVTRRRMPNRKREEDGKELLLILPYGKRPRRLYSGPCTDSSCL